MKWTTEEKSFLRAANGDAVSVVGVEDRMSNPMQLHM